MGNVKKFILERSGAALLWSFDNENHHMEGSCYDRSLRETALFIRI